MTAADEVTAADELAAEESSEVADAAILVLEGALAVLVALAEVEDFTEGATSDWIAIKGV